MSYAFRTLLLLVLMSAVLLGIGYFFGGFIGLTIGLIIAVAINFITYWFSDKIVLKIYGAKPLKDKKINDIVRKLAEKAKIPMPKTYLVDMDVPNAFATGRNENHAAVAVTTGLVERLNDDEIEGVLAHELSHIRHNDILVSSVAATMASAITWIAYIFLFSGDDEGGNILGLLLAFILAPIAASLIQLAITRNREYYADQGGAELTNPLHLAHALDKISKAGKVKGSGSKTATAHMFIVNPFSARSLSNLFSTHPPVEERIKRLKELSKNH